MSTRICDELAASMPSPLPPAPLGPPVPFELTDDYWDMARQIAGSRKRSAGLRGGYLGADSPEGRACFERFEAGRGTYLWGPPGRGKTWAAACCVRLAVERRRRARLVTAKALLDEVKAEWDGGEKGTLERAEGYDLLALDDLGMERPTGWAIETLTGLIDARTAAGLPTVYTSNYSTGQLRDLWGGVQGDRVASRIAGTCERVEMTGPDRRLA